MRRSARRLSSRCHDAPIPPQGPRHRPPSSSCGGCANTSPRPAWTPAPTPSPGTCATTTKPRCRCPRSAGSCPAKAWSSRSRPSDPGPPTYASRPSNPTRPGNPASTLTDNGMVYTTRFAGGRGGRNHLEYELRRLHIVQKNSRPNHPTTCGKAERFQQTMKKWLAAQPVQPSTVADLQGHLDRFLDAYNH